MYGRCTVPLSRPANLPKWPTQKPRSRPPVPPWQIGRLGDADSRPGRDFNGCGPCQQRKRRLVERRTVMGIRDRQRLAQPSRSGAKKPFVMDATAATHDREALSRHQGANQDRAGAALRFADEIDAPVDAIGAVDIHMAWRSEHHSIAGGRSPKAVRRRVSVVISLNFDDRSADAVGKKYCADQIRRHRVNAAFEKVWR